MRGDRENSWIHGEMKAMRRVEKIEFGKHIWGDDRGWGANPMAPMGMPFGALGDLHVVSIKPGKVRGNHYHPESTEWVLIFGGEARLIWRDLDDKTAHETIVAGSETTLYRIPPKIEHAVINEDSHDIYLISFSDTQKRGTVRAPLLDKLLEGDAQEP
jgi:oxalate decarboxylase/phosphoglucose isomerase-like protein (cupin superfamily)